MSKYFNNLNQQIYNSKLLINHSLLKVNQNILNLFNYKNSNANHFSKIIFNYLENNSGKQLRPLLLLLTYNAIFNQQSQNFKQNNQNDLINLASFVELIHIASILHDDVLDHAEFRRSQKTMHRSLGNKFTILCGDLIYSKAFKLIANISQNQKISGILTNTINCMVEGEIMQYLEKYNFAISEDKYLEIITAKTAKLFSTITQLPVLLDVEIVDLINCLTTYGLNLGIAYQLLNDLEDYYNNGEDILNGIITLPIIFVLNKPNSAINQKIINIIKQQVKLNPVEQQQQLEILRNIILINGGFNYTVELANNYLNKAIQAIDILKDSKYKQAILDLTKSYLIEKNLTSTLSCKTTVLQDKF